jgi:hypothetical protein
MRNGVTDFGGAFKTDLEHTMQQACKLLGSDALGALSEGSTTSQSQATRDHGASRLSTVPKTRSLITIASTFQ